VPGIFWFLLAICWSSTCCFIWHPQNRWVAASYFWWFSAINLILISVFWTLMADLFTARTGNAAVRVHRRGRQLGRDRWPIITLSLVRHVGVDGLLLVGIRLSDHDPTGASAGAGKGQGCVPSTADAQQTTLDHSLPGNPLRGFKLLLRVLLI
jgi:ATP:ADP antiporter, AAA family